MIEVIRCSYRDVMSDPEYFAWKFLHDGVFGIRGLNATEEQQLDIILAMGDYVGWVPRNDDFDRTVLRRYEEDHEHTFAHGYHTELDLSVNWHLEHVFSSVENSTVAGFWNMLKFDCSPSVGMTYFKNNSKLLEALPSDTVDFMRKAVVTSSVISDRKGNLTHSNPRNAVEKHPFKEAEVLRICQGDVSLFSFDGREPTENEKSQFEAHVDIIETDIVYNLSSLLTWNWEVGDMLISDLFLMSHAVAGGFKPGERKFLGYFCSHHSIDNDYLFQ